MTNHQTEEYSNRDDEIDLIDYLNVLWRWKTLIILGTLSCILAVGIVSFRSPRVYRSTMVIEPGQLGQDYIDSVAAIAKRIESGVYDRKVIEKIKSSEDLLKINWKVDYSAETGQIFVSLDHTNSDFAVQSLNALLTSILETYEQEVKVYEQSLDNELERTKIKIQEIDINEAFQSASIKKEKIALQLKFRELEDQFTIQKRETKIKEGEIKTIRTHQKTLKEKKKKILSTLDLVEANSKDLMKVRVSLAEQTELEKDAIAVLLFTDIAQRSMEYANVIRTDVYDIENQMDDMEQSIRVKEAEVSNIKTRIASFETRKKSLQNDFDKWVDKTQQAQKGLEIDKRNLELSMLETEEKRERTSPLIVFSAPAKSLSPVGPNRRKDVAMAGVMGFFIFIFLAFLLEYIKSVRERRAAFTQDKGVIAESPSLRPNSEQREVYLSDISVRTPTFHHK